MASTAGLIRRRLISGIPSSYNWTVMLAIGRISPSCNCVLPLRFFGHKARIGNQISNLRESMLEKQHEDSVSRKKASKKNSHGNSVNTAASNVDDDDTKERRDMDEFDAGLNAFQDAETHPQEEGPKLPDTIQLKEKMSSVVKHLETSLRQIRGNEPTPDMFDSITVFAYGAATPLSSVAQVVIVSPTLAKLSCYDPSMASATRDAIRDAGMNLNPRIDADSSADVVVPIPKVSAETRKVLVKQIGQMGEKSRTKIRNIRRTAHEIVKKGQLGKLEGTSKDDAFRVGKEVEAVTEESIALINQVIENKQRNVLAT